MDARLDDPRPLDHPGSPGDQAPAAALPGRTDATPVGALLGGPGTSARAELQVGDTAPAPAAPRASGEDDWSARLVQALRSHLRIGVFLLLFYTVFFHVSVVRGSSMNPGIHDGDRILVEPWSYLLDGPARGDVVVLRYPLDPSVDYIKRVIGLPGDQVTLVDGHVWVNGELLMEPYVSDVDHSTYLTAVVEEGNCFVLGDNRPRSSDSREFGQVPMDHVRGRVDLRLWPLSRLGWVE